MKTIRGNYNNVGIFWSIRLWLARKLSGNKSVIGNCDLINVEPTVNSNAHIYDCRFLSGSSQAIKKAFSNTFSGKKGITLKPFKWRKSK